MKNLITLLIIIPLLSSAQTEDELTRKIIANTFDKTEFVMNRATLQNIAYVPNKMIFLISDTAVTDGRGGFYYYDPNATGVDTVLMNTIWPNPRKALSTGRWVKVFQRERQFPGGKMEYNGTTRRYTTSALTDASGNITLKLTEDTTSTGIALFKKIDGIIPLPDVAASQLTDAIISFPKKTMADATYLKTPMFGFYKPNAISITLASLPIVGLLPVASVGPGIKVNFLVFGQ